jgi:organic radical activating enzyme
MPKEITSPIDLIDYQEIVITGGEPMLYPDEVLKFISLIRNVTYNRQIYMYTSYWNGAQKSYDLLSKLDGITFTLHAECNDRDIIALKDLSNTILKSKNNRLFIDTRVYDKYDLSNIDFTNWKVVRKLQWKVECEPAVNEDLLYFNIKSLFRKE